MKFLSSAGKRASRALALVLSLMLLLTMTAVPAFAADSAAAVAATDPSLFEYDERYDGTIEITGYNGDDKDTMTELDIPAEIDGKSVTSIGRYAFKSCTILTSVAISDGITSIDSSAFEDCTSLTSVTIPKSVTSIGNYAFGYYNRHWNENDNLVYDKVDGFKITGYKNSAAYRYAMENGFEFVSLGEVSPFVYYEIDDESIGLTKYTGYESQLDIPAEIDGKSVTSIRYNAFSECVSLTSVTIPESVTLIDQYAFENCTSLTSVTISEGVTEIGWDAFFGCTSLKSVTIPKSVTSIGNRAFGYYQGRLTSDYVKVDGFTIMGYKNSVAYRYAMENGFEFVSLGEISPFIYEEFNDGTIRITGYNGYEEQLDIPAVIDEKSVIYIGSEAFYGCENLKAVTIPKSITSIGSMAFGYCNHGQKVDGFKITGYKNSAAYKYAMKNDFEFVSLGEINPFVYDEIDNETVEITGYNGYEAQLDIPEELDGKSVTSIRYYAFGDCENLKAVTIPKSVTSIEDQAFGYYDYGQKVDGFKITGYKNSGAYKYAMENGFEFVSLGEVSPFVYNELNDGTIEITDYTGYEAQLDIPEEIDGKSVTSIRYYAFGDCENLKAVTIPKSVTSIDDRAFGYYDYLQKVDGFKITGYKNSGAYRYAMENGFEFVSLGEVSPFVYYELDDETVEITGYNGYESQLDIPAKLDGKSVTEIGRNAFRECVSLTSVTIPEGVTYIGMEAFYGCPKLKNVTIPKSVTSISDYKALGYYFDIEAWTEKKIDGFTITGYKNSAAYAYARDEGFKFVSLGEVSPFACNVLEDGTLEIFEYYGDKDTVTNLVIPEKIDGKQVSSIGSSNFYNGDGIFENCTNLEKVTISEGITSIGSYTFSGCTGITSVTIPESMTEIGYSAFSGCTSLSNVTIYKNMTSIYGSAFDGCTSLKSVTIAEGVKSIGYTAFNNCPNLKGVTIPKSVTSIGSNAFGYCEDEETGEDIKVGGFTITGYKNSAAYAYAREEGFEFVSLGEVSPFACNVLDNGTLAIYAYYGDDRDTMTRLDIPAKIDGKQVTSIGWGVFQAFASLESVVIPEGVTGIASGAFAYCPNLKSVTIPEGVTNIGMSAFDNCPKLKNMTLPKSVSSVGRGAFGYYFDNKEQTSKKVDGFTITGYKYSVAYAYARDNGFKFVSLGEVSPFVYNELDDKTVEITDYYGDDSKLDIPAKLDGKKVTSIGYGAFSNCTNLESVTIPEGVTEIGDTAFAYCQNLKSVTIPKSVTSIGERAFGYYNGHYDDNGDYVYDKVNGFTITGYAGTAAEDYANENGFEFIALDNVMLGDVDNNGSVTIADAIMVQKHIVSILTLTGDQITVADVDKNGEISIADAIMIQKDIVGIIDINAA